MLIDYHLGQSSIVLRVKIRNSSVSTGAGLTGLTNASAGLTIAAIADNEATTTAYTAAGASIDTIATLGTYAAPTAGHCRFKEVDAANHRGIYELQLDNARYAVSGAKSLLVSIGGAANAAECDVVIPLRQVDPYNATTGGLANLDAAVSTRSTYAGADTSGTTTLLSRLTATRATNLDNLDAAVSTRLAAAAYTAPDNTDVVSILASVGSGLKTELDAVKAKTDGLPASFPTNFAALAITAGGAVTAGTVSDKTGYSLAQAFPANFAGLAITAGGAVTVSLTQALGAARALDAIADTSLTLNDALHCAIAAAAGKELIAGTSYVVQTPSTGTTIRTFTLDNASAPTSRT